MPCSGRCAEFFIESSHRSFSRSSRRKLARTKQTSRRQWNLKPPTMPARSEDKETWKYESCRWTIAQDDAIKVWISEDDSQWQSLCELKEGEIAVLTGRSGNQKGKKYLKFSGVNLQRTMAVVSRDTPEEIRTLLTEEKTFDHSKVKGNS
jgi:hypothetical protein